MLSTEQFNSWVGGQTDRQQERILLCAFRVKIWMRRIARSGCNVDERERETLPVILREKNCINNMYYAKKTERSAAESVQKDLEKPGIKARRPDGGRLVQTGHMSGRSHVTRARQSGPGEAGLR